jgi:predicted transcriptional regulator
LESQARPEASFVAFGCCLIRREANSAGLTTGHIAASIQELADASGAPPGEVYRPLSRLVEVGALARTGRGR